MINCRKINKTMKKVYVGLMALIVASCSVVKVPQATGGSKSDGTIELSYEYGQFIVPDVDWNKALHNAKQRCIAWGYQSAEPFGGRKKICQSYDNDGNCSSRVVTKKYQCVDR